MLEHIKNLNRGELVFWFVVVLITWLVFRLVRDRYRLARDREMVRRAEATDARTEPHHWPSDWEDRRNKFLGLCRGGKPTGAVAQHGTNPILVLAHEDYRDWDTVPEEKRELIESAQVVWTFDANDYNSRAGASNRISQLDRITQKLRHNRVDPITLAGLTEELKRTVIFVGTTYGAETGRIVAKAALPNERTHIVDAIFDIVVLAAKRRQEQPKTKPTTPSSGLEIDLGD